MDMKYAKPENAPYGHSVIQMLVEVICTLICILFLYAAVSKLLEFDKFRIQLGLSPLLSPFAGVVSVFIPAVEIVLSILVFTRKYRFVALCGSYCLMVIFSAYIVWILNFSEFIPCSCGGILENMGWRQHLVFNMIFTALCGAGVWFETDLQSRPVTPERI